MALTLVELNEAQVHDHDLGLCPVCTDHMTYEDWLGTWSLEIRQLSYCDSGHVFFQDADSRQLYQVTKGDTS